MKEQQQLRTTFGQLEHVADKVVLPSTLNYRERAEMQKKHGCEYGRSERYKHVHSNLSYRAANILFVTTGIDTISVELRLTCS